MSSIFENCIKLLNKIGFPIKSIEDNSEILTFDQLYLTHPTGLTLVEYLSRGNIPEVQMLQDDREFTFLFLRSLKFHQIEIPQIWLSLDDFSIVCERDKKISNEQTSNGLFYYCSKYNQEHQFQYKPIIRQNGSRAFLFTLDGDHRHLTIDETISSVSHESAIFTYAHVTIIKGKYTLRYYFNHHLENVKITATDNLLEKKVYLNELEGIELSNQDYQAGLDILTQLKKLHREKIESLDLQLKPIFFFISNVEILNQCQSLIEEINALKSPIYDQRQRILQRLQQHPPLNFIYTPTEIPSSTAVSTENVTLLKNTSSKSKSRLKPQNGTSKRQQIQESMLKEISRIFAMVNQQVLSIHELESLFQSIQDFELSIIYQFDILTPKQRSNFDRDLQGFKDQIIKHIHRAFTEGRQNDLNALYDATNEYIDGLLIGLIQRFQKQLTQIQKLSVTERQEMNQLLDLMMHFYPKNSFYRAYLHVLSSQYGFSQAGIHMYSMLMRIIYVLDSPQFILFLINEGLFAPTDCICVNEYKYLSLIQFLLICLKHLHPSFLGLLEHFQTCRYSIVDVTHIDTFQSFIDKPKQIKASILTSDGKTCPQSEMIAIQKICSGLSAARPTSLIDYGGTHPFHFRDAIHANVAQDFMLQHPSLAFLYLSNLLNKQDIYRRAMLGNGHNLAILTSPSALNHVTSQLSPTLSQQIGMNYIYYPNTETCKNSIDSLEMACEFIDKLKDQTYIQERQENPSWLIELYQAALTSPQTTIKSNGILGVILYLILIPHWSPDTFQKYCFYNLKRIDCLIEANFNYQYIATDFLLLVDLIHTNTDAKTQSICLRFIQTKLDKLIESDIRFQSLKSELFP